MSYLNDVIMDDGLQTATDNVTRIDVCSQEPTTYAEATSTYSLGNKTGLTCGDPEDRTPSGRKVVIPAFTDGEGTADGNATHWAATNGSDTLYAANELDGTLAVEDGGVVQVASMEIGIPDPA